MFGHKNDYRFKYFEIIVNRLSVKRKVKMRSFEFQIYSWPQPYRVRLVPSAANVCSWTFSVILICNEWKPCFCWWASIPDDLIGALYFPFGIDKCQVKPINVSTTCKMKILCCVEMFLAITICHQIGHGRRLMPRIKTNSTLKYSKFAYSVFSVRQFTSDNSTLVFQFKTLKKHGMLFYMDDEGANFIDAFLLRGQLRIRLTIGSCKGKQFINGSFTDLEWHRIILKRTPETVLLTVDNRNASSFKICNRVGETSFKKLYVSSFPFEEWLQPIKWMFRDSWELSLKHGG